MDILTYGALLNKAKPTDEQVTQAVDDWLDDHPEATTTVQDGAITYAKLNSDLKNSVDDVTNLKSHVDDLTITSTETQNIQYNGQLLDGYVTVYGTTGGFGDYYHTDKIPVNEGDVLSFISPYNTPARFICAYNSSDSAVSGSGSGSQVRSFTVPSGISSVVVSYDIRNNIGYEFKIIRTTVASVSDTAYVNKTELSADDVKIIKQKTFHTLPNAISGSVNNEQGLELNCCCCQHKAISFRGDITTFADLYFGLKHNDVRELYVKIDSTSLTLYNNVNVVDTAQHGLTFTDYIQVTITANDATAQITIATLSGVFTHTFSNWPKNPAILFAETDESALTDCSILFVPIDISKRVWIFGDSYMSYANNRVLYWIKNLGATDFCVNALPGETSNRAMLDLMFMLQYATPTIIVWAMGMNDGDSSTSVSDRWNIVYNLLKNICTEKGIELVLYTVPTIPSVNNEYKDTIVRNSGYRYIDAASAVNASASGVWYTGMLSSDGIHPNTTGAIAIADAAILTVPELFG